MHNRIKLCNPFTYNFLPLLNHLVTVCSCLVKNVAQNGRVESSDGSRQGHRVRVQQVQHRHRRDRNQEAADFLKKMVIKFFFACRIINLKFFMFKNDLNFSFTGFTDNVPHIFGYLQDVKRALGILDIISPPDCCVECLIEHLLCQPIPIVPNN
jgi:hypothetical protein